MNKVVSSPIASDDLLSSSTTFSVVTATYNAAALLPQLIRSLLNQSDHDFEWIVADGGSTDNTLDILDTVKGKLNIKIDSRPDSGIYDALNRAVQMATGNYYIVMGADDELAPEAIAQYRQCCSYAGTDFVTAKVNINGRINGIYKHRWDWLSGMYAYISGHAVGVAICRTLHDRIGYYDQRFSLVADQLFVVSAMRSGACVTEVEFVAGKYSSTGISSAAGFRRAMEKFRMQHVLGSNLLLQTILLVWRLAKCTVMALAHWALRV